MKRVVLIGLLVLGVAAGLLWLIAGFTNVGGNGMNPTHTSIASVTGGPDPLDGTRWELVAIESEATALHIPEQPGLFIAFSGGELSLQGGCNDVGGHYQIDGNRITVSFVVATQVDCSDSMPGINATEVGLSNAMPTFESFVIEGDQLRINYAEGKVLFRR